MPESYSSELVKQMFSSTVDDCERLVAAMQYCSFIPTINTFSNAVVVTLLEKGVLYRGMLDFANLSLLDQCRYIHNKFTEFHERLMIIDVEIKIAKSNLEDLLYAILSRVESNFCTRKERMPSLKLFHIAKIGPAVIIFDSKVVSSVEECKVIIINDSVTIIDLSWQNISHLVRELIDMRFPFPQYTNSYLSASLICLVRDREEEEEGPQTTSYDNQLLDFQNFVHMCKNEEATGNKFGLRESTEEGFQGTTQVEHNPFDLRHCDFLPPPPSSSYPPSLEATQKISDNALRNSHQIQRSLAETDDVNVNFRASTKSLSDPPLPPFGTAFAAHDEWTEGSQSVTILHNEVWGTRKPISIFNNTMSSQDFTRGEDDNVQCNQSLSEFSVPMNEQRNTENEARPVNNDTPNLNSFHEVQTSISRLQDILRDDNVKALTSSLLHTTAFREGLSAISTLTASLQASNRDLTDPRTLGEISRDPEGNGTNTVPSQSSSVRNVAPTHSPSPVKPTYSSTLPQQAAAAAAQSLGTSAPNKPAAKSAISESLRQDLLASEAGEDFLGYAQRAYMAIRHRAVENTDYNLSMTMSTTQPFSFAGPPVTGGMNADHRNVPQVSDSPLSMATMPSNGNQEQVLPGKETSTPASSALAKEIATPKSLQSVRSANHENFDDFFAGTEETVPTAEKRSSHLEDMDEEDDDDDYVVIHHVNRNNRDDRSAPKNQPSSTVAALDDLLDDLSIHTPTGRPSLSVGSSVSTSQSRSPHPNLSTTLSEQRRKAPQYAAGNTGRYEMVASQLEPSSARVGPSATSNSTSVSAEPAVSFSSRSSIVSESSNVVNKFPPSSNVSNISPRTENADSANQHSHRENPVMSAAATTASLNSIPRSSTGNLILLQALLENMKAQRAALEHRQLQQAQERNHQRIRIGREVLHMLQQQAVNEHQHQQEMDDTNTWDRKRWPPPEANRCRSLGKKSPAKTLEFDSVASALRSRPISAQMQSPPMREINGRQHMLETEDDEETSLAQLRSQRLISGREKSVRLKESASSLQPAPSSSQQPVRLPTHPLVTDQNQSSCRAKTSTMHKPVAWQVDLGSDGHRQSTSGIQRPRSRPRSWSANRSVRLTYCATNHEHGNCQARDEENRGGVDEFRSLNVRQAPSEDSAHSSPTSASHLHPQSQLIVRPRSQSAQRSRVATAGAAGAASASKLSNFIQSKNAISYVCLAGGHQEEKRLDVLDLMDFYAQGTLSSTLPLLQGSEFVVSEDMRGKISQFVIMFYKAKTLAFKGIYVLDPKTRYLVRVYGKGPHRINSEGEVSELAKEFLKFETSSKSFKTLPVKSLTSTVDAIILNPPKARNVPV